MSVSAGQTSTIPIYIKVGARGYAVTIHPPSYPQAAIIEEVILPSQVARRYWKSGTNHERLDDEIES